MFSKTVSEDYTEKLYSSQKDMENGTADFMSQKTFQWNKLTSKEKDPSHMMNFL